MSKQISANVVARLPKYYRCLKELCENGVARVSSKTISEALNLTASQVRQDLSNFGGFGQQGYGYDTEYLMNRIRDILGLTKSHTAIIVGGGRIGQALANYNGFANENIEVLAIFDIKTEHIKNVSNITVHNMSELPQYLKNNKVDIAIISVQKEQAQAVAKKVIENGIKAIWNFAPIDLNFGKGIVCENINMSESLMRLIFNSKNVLN
ncbi:MAG: redox-sensing transcriptional repressor Rex [Clostridia bacterium]|nr:redox-sensing transcriptional repressor Rex [Clostridia bacterium]